MTTPALIKITLPDGTVVDEPKDITQEALTAKYPQHILSGGGPSAAFDSALAARKQAIEEHQRPIRERRAQLREYRRQHPEEMNIVEQTENELGDDSLVDQRKPRIPGGEQNQFLTTLKLGLVNDAPTKQRIMADSMFPGDPEGMYKVGIVEGEPVYLDKDGNLRRVSSGLAALSANAVANAPEMAGAVIGAEGGPGLSSFLATGMHGLKRSIAGLAFDEPQTIGGNAKEMAIEGGVNLAGEGLGRTLAKIGNASRTVDFSPVDMMAAEARQKKIKAATDIDIDLAQASNDSRLIALRAFGARYPGKSANMVQASEDKSKIQFGRHADRSLNAIAKEQPSEVAGGKAVNAARNVIRAAQDQVNAKAAPFYKAAYDSVPQVTDPKLLAFLKLPYFPEAYKRGQRIATLEETATRKGVERTSTYTREKQPGGFYKMKEHVKETPIEQPDLRAMDYTKRGLEDVIEKLKDAGRGEEARALRNQQKKFVKALDDLASPEWQRARQVYGALVKSRIEPLRNGPVGVLSRIDDADVQSAANRILSDAEISTDQILKTRAAIEKQDPDAWRGIVRNWLATKWDKAQRETQAGETANPAGKLRQAIWGSPKTAERTAAMLDPKAKQLFDDLMEAAQDLARTPIRGSNTFRDTETKKILTGNVGKMTGMFRAILSPRETLMNAAEQRAAEQGVLAVTEAILDSSKRGQLRVILKMKPSTRRTILLSNLLIAQGAKIGAQTKFPQSDDIGAFADTDEILPPE